MMAPLRIGHVITSQDLSRQPPRPCIPSTFNGAYGCGHSLRVPRDAGETLLRRRQNPSPTSSSCGDRICRMKVAHSGQ